MLARPDVQAVWREFVYHPFVMAMGNGTLPLESFKGYMIQDYLYLVSHTVKSLYGPKLMKYRYTTQGPIP